MLNDSVLHRLILHVAPLAAVWVVLAYGHWWGMDKGALEKERAV
jgi:hypothetical protein